MLDHESAYWQAWKKRPRGRPSRFTAKLAEKIYACGRYGLTDAQTAQLLDLGIATLHRWKKGSASFRWKLQEAKAEADERVERSLFEICQDRTLTVKITKRTRYDYEAGVKTVEVITERDIPPDLGAIMNWLYNRRPDRWNSKPQPPAFQSITEWSGECVCPQNVDPQAKQIAEAITKILDAGL